MPKGKDRRSPAFARLRRGRQSATTIPVALTIAGSDSSAGAGLQADLKTFSALGVYGLTAVTCVVAETPGKVSHIQPVAGEMVREQIGILAKNFPIAAIKTGLLCSVEIVEAVAQAIVDLPRVPLVIDPVIVATSGDLLLEPDAINAYERHLFPLATLITPNLDEAERLLGQKIRDRQSMKNAARALAKKYGMSILLKGGHLANGKAVDFLCADGKITQFAAPFVRGIATHGTGCTYSAAITAGLASGFSIQDAIGRAKKFISSCIANHFRWRSPEGETIDALNHLAQGD